MIHGNKGSILNDKYFTRDIFNGQEDFQKFNSTLVNSGEVSHHPFGSLINAFIDDILNDVDSNIRLEYGIKVHKVCLAIDKSAETGEKVRLPILKPSGRFSNA